MKRVLSDVSGGRNNNFDFLRFALATLVIFSHSYPLLLKPNAEEPFWFATVGQRTGGELAVDGFFILSGFLIAKSWKSSRGLEIFLRNRFLRIYPGFLLAIAFSALIVAPILSDNATVYWQAFSWRNFVVHGLNLNYYTPPTKVPSNGSLWTIRYEFMCYLTVAFLGLCGLLYRGSIIFLGLIFCLIMYAGQIYFHLKPYGTSLSWLYCYPGDWPRLMGDFMGGVLFFAYRNRIYLSWPLMSIAVAGLLMLGVVLPSLKALPLALPLLAPTSCSSWPTYPSAGFITSPGGATFLMDCIFMRSPFRCSWCGHSPNGLIPSPFFWPRCHLPRSSPS